MLQPKSQLDGRRTDQQGDLLFAFHPDILKVLGLLECQHPSQETLLIGLVQALIIRIIAAEDIIEDRLVLVIDPIQTFLFDTPAGVTGKEPDRSRQQYKCQGDPTIG